MIEVAALTIVVIAGVFLLVLGATSFLAPLHASGFLLAFAPSPAKHYSELALRLIAGGAFVLSAPSVFFACLRRQAAKELIRAFAGMKFTAVVVLFALLAPVGAHACTCVPPGTVGQEMDESSSVFLGRVTSIEERTPEMNKRWWDSIVAWFSGLFGEPVLPTDRDFPYKRVTFSVSETFKGAPATELHLTTGMGGGDCGYFFEEAQDYVVYAYGEPGDLTASICSLTGPASDPGSGLEDLRGGR